MKKALIYGSIFGFVFGIFELIAEATGLGLLKAIMGLLSLAAYITLLIIIMQSEAKKGAGYGKRFLAGFVFSIMIGVVFGIIDGISGFVFAEQLAESADEASNNLLNSFDMDTTELETVDTEASPIANLLGGIFLNPLFNAIAGAFWSAIFAAFFKPAEAKAEVKKEA